MADDRAAVADLLDYWTPLLLRMCVQAGVIAAFGREACSPDDVAARTGTHAPTLVRVVRALASRGIFEPCEHGEYRLSRLGRHLLADEPGTMVGLATYRPPELHAWAEALHSLETGEPSFPRHFGTGYWDHLSTNPVAAEQFNAQMRRQTLAQLEMGLPVYDWPNHGTVVDLAGGNGTLLERVLSEHPGLGGVLVDLPHAIDQARSLLSDSGLFDRVELVAADLFVDDLPVGHDIYVLANVLHDWDDAHANAILDRCRRAMSPDARLVLFESVLRPGVERDRAKLMDLHMLVLFGAKERTREQWTELLEAAGFALTRVIATPGLKSWLEASPR